MRLQLAEARPEGLVVVFKSNGMFFLLGWNFLAVFELILAVSLFFLFE